ncbi:tetratricopeptide repeat protein [Candidatus Kaiserbacteria bacterium]|nr:tetratricopeptide repeat protein [Candidatus Kaiserbacteria bacterium]
MPSPEHFSDDPIAMRLITIAQYVLVVVFGLLPIFFIPSLAAPFAYSKVLFAVAGVFLAIILYGFALLRGGAFRVQLLWAPIVLWIIALIALVSALLSGDFRDALIGETFEVHSALFVVLLALVASAWTILGTNKTAIMRLFIFLSGSTVALSLFHILRLLFGADFLSLGLFAGDPTLSPFGGWNDLAIFFGLAIMLSLVALEQLRLTRLGQILFGFVVIVALVMLALINFFAVWIVLGLVSLVLLIYGLTKDRFVDKTVLAAQKQSLSTVSLIVSLVVLVASVVFILGGSVVGNAIGRATNISYLEVRPSFRATTDITRNVYNSDALFGVGPNRFVDAWRQYKDNSINESIFWNTDFIAGFGYVPTFFATMGLLGGLAWIAFFALFLVAGLRMLLRTTSNDRLWYFIGTTSFVGGVYIWGMTVVYVPGPALLLIAALCTGLVSASYGVLMHTKTYGISSQGSRQMMFLFIIAFLVLVIGSVSSVYFIGRHYAGVYTFNSSVPLIAAGSSLDDIEARTVQAYIFSRDDAYARRLAEYQIARMNNLLNVAEPTEEQKQQFNNALNSAINAAQVAVSGDQSDPRNVNILGTVYATLVPAKIEGAYDRAVESFTRAKDLDPHNPLRLLTLAELSLASGKNDEARQYAESAIAMKSNYSDAIFFLAQLDIAAGNTDAAVAGTRAVTVLEPQNPVRFFQLGVLLLSSGKMQEAISSLGQAVGLDQNYANARFYLALAYDTVGEKSKAREQLDAVLASNPGNEIVTNLLGRLDRGEPLLQTAAPQTTIPESSGVSAQEGAVTASSTPDTPLVTPVNTPNTGETAQ